MVQRHVKSIINFTMNNEVDSYEEDRVSHELSTTDNFIWTLALESLSNQVKGFFCTITQKPRFHQYFCFVPVILI